MDATIVATGLGRRPAPAARRRCLVLAVAVSVTVSATGCTGGGGDADRDGPVTPTGAARLSVTSPELEDGGDLPVEFTCDGIGEAPTLRWQPGPEGTASYAVHVVDPDAPSGAFTHWAISDVPPDVTEVSAGDLPEAAVVGRNDGDGTGWQPACPPEGDPPHTYEFVVYALGDAPGLAAGFDPGELEDLVEEVGLAVGSIAVTYQR